MKPALALISACVLLQIEHGIKLAQAPLMVSVRASARQLGASAGLTGAGSSLPSAGRLRAFQLSCQGMPMQCTCSDAAALGYLAYTGARAEAISHDHQLASSLRLRAMTGSQHTLHVALFARMAMP